MYSFFLARFAWGTEKREAAALKPTESFLLGDQKNFLPPTSGESARTSHENCFGGSEKSRAPAGAGRRVFAQAVPAKAGTQKDFESKKVVTRVN